MKKGKSRNKRKKTRSRLLWIAIAVIGIAAVISAVCVAGMLATKENAWKTPEELLVEYMDHIPKQEYEEMYAMLHIEASGNVSQEDFVTRNSAIYEGIEVQNIRELGMMEQCIPKRLFMKWYDKCASMLRGDLNV